MSEKDVTELLLDLSGGNATAIGLLLPIVYNELRRLAASYLSRERVDHTLQPTALVHEAYIKLIDQTRTNWQNRAHFFGVAANVMRRILIDHARLHNADKRGAEYQKLQLDTNIDKAVEMRSELIALDEALKELEKIAPEQAKLVELRFFGGLTFEETAEVLGVSLRTVKRQWRFVRAWLYGKMIE
ncbi:MAG TPA: sigma-70 family RNA polymerase sigma factor [Pyrinomonadaceae bacterium]|nr:sigma-70 family RNA polymerase sigma factor [Pyrinomonadaceae bacterium]